ncbi:MAG: YbbR-like domain-containing protein [Vicinamibacterales bacterium]
MKAPWPFGHFGLKVLSVAFAVFLWFVVSGEEVVERGLRVPLELQQFPATLELQGEAPSLVDVRVRGASGALSRIGSGDIVAVLDLKAARPGRRLYQLTPEQVRVPFGVQVVQVAPPTIVLAFEASAMKQVPVVPAVEGDPAPGYVIGKVTVDPATVEVVGAESAVARVTEAVTEPVSVLDAHSSVSESVPVGFLDPALRLKTPRLAHVSVEVNPGPVERAIEGRPVQLRNTGPRLLASSTPNIVEVVMRGSREGVGRVDAEDVVAFVDLAGLGAGEYTLGVHVDAPAGAGVARIDPSTVRVRITSDKN